jgi:hypothetical protein
MPVPETGDEVSIAVLFASMNESWGRTGKEAEALGLDDQNEGCLGVYQTLLDHAKKFEEISCEVVDFDNFGEVWTYWVDEKGSEIIKLIGLDDSHPEFRGRVLEFFKREGVPTITKE